MAKAWERTNRRAFLRGGAVAALGLTAAACGWPGEGFGTTAAESGGLVYWNLFSGGDGVRMTQMEDAFERAHPGIGLEATTLAWGNPYYTKLSMATLAGAPPDVAAMHLTRMPALAQAGLLTPFDDAELGRHGIRAQDFLDRPWQRAHYGGRLYAIPIDTHPFVLYYNTAVAKRAGLLDRSGRLTPIDSASALLDALAAAKRVTGAFGLALSWVNDYATAWRLFLTLYSQIAGGPPRVNGTAIELDDAPARTALDFARQLTVGRALAPPNLDYASAVALFASGKAGFFMEGEWEVTTFQTAKTPFDMTTFPTLYDHPAVQADSHSLVVPALRGGGRDRMDRALTFVRSMLDQGLRWAGGGHIPAWKPVEQSAAYRHLRPQSDYAASVDRVVYDPLTWYSGSGSDLEIAMGSVIGSVVGGLATPETALTEMRTALRRLAATAPPVGGNARA